jgi:hypothetical protein
MGLTRLRQILTFANVPAGGGLATLPHDINVDGIARIPDVIALDNLAFDVTAPTDSGQVTVVNQTPAGAAATCHAWLFYDHSIDRAYPGEQLAPAPFVIRGGGLFAAAQPAPILLGVTDLVGSGALVTDANINNLARYWTLPVGADDTLQFQFWCPAKVNWRMQMDYAMSAADPGTVSIEMDYTAFRSDGSDNPSANLGAGAVWTMTPGADTNLHSLAATFTGASTDDITVWADNPNPLGQVPVDVGSLVDVILIRKAGTHPGVAHIYNIAFTPT